MSTLIKPKDYEPTLSKLDTQRAIKKIRVFLENKLEENLNLTRVSAPLFVRPESGLNDDLAEKERAITFDISEQKGDRVEIVKSLAKWKRFALKEYEFEEYEGLYTNMNTIHRDEVTSNISSLCYDEWDFEKIINKKDRNLDFLKDEVKKIYKIIKETEAYINSIYEVVYKELPDEIFFITTQQMEDEFPELSSDERESYYAKKYGAIFVMQIGDKLKSGFVHKTRACDYDDWQLNGDMIFYYDVLDMSIAICKMGIRVSEDTMREQIMKKGEDYKLILPFQMAVMNKILPLSIGGGIGQSKLSMFLLKKAHIGEVQASIWPEQTVNECKKLNINLL